MAFLMGFATGPRRQPCPGLHRLGRASASALQAILYHELAILVGAVPCLALTWGPAEPDRRLDLPAALGMRQSAKLNVFLGVRNLNEQFLPPHLAYLGSFFARSR
jgi:putative photosynthetic complex assembly protein 2